MKVEVKKDDLGRAVKKLTDLMQSKQGTVPAGLEMVDKMTGDGLFNTNANPGAHLPNGQTVASLQDISWDSPDHVSKRWQGDARYTDNAKTKLVCEDIIKCDSKSLDGVATDFPQLATLEDQAKLKALQNIHDGWVFCSGMVKDWSPRSSPRYDTYRRLMSDLSNKALTTTGSGTGLEFIPTILSGQLVPLFRQQLTVSNAFTHFNMPGKIFVMPLEGTDVNPYFVSETTTDDPPTTSNDISPRDANTGSVTFTAGALKVRGRVSSEADEDSIIAALPYMRGKLTQSIANGIDSAILDGDTTSTHQDSDVTASDEYRKIWDGLRFLSNSGAVTHDATGNSSSGLLTVEAIANVIVAMGRFGAPRSSDLTIWTSPAAYVHVAGNSQFQTLEKMGPNASLVTGQVGAIYGASFVVSEFIRTNLNDAGVYDGSTTNNTTAVVCHTPSFGMGDRRAITVNTIFNPFQDVWDVLTTWRGDFQRIQAEATGHRNVGYVYNIDATATIN